MHAFNPLAPGLLRLRALVHPSAQPISLARLSPSPSSDPGGEGGSIQDVLLTYCNTIHSVELTPRCVNSHGCSSIAVEPAE